MKAPKKTKLKFKRANTLDEFDTIFDLDQKVFHGFEYGSMAYETEMDNSDWWIAYTDGKPVGYCGVTIIGEFAFHKRAGILKQYRGLGFQRRALQIREKYAKAQKCINISTYVSVDNPHSLNNLIRGGYLSYVPQNKWGEICAVYLTKDLR